jgi:hypothetical protein
MNLSPAEIIERLGGTAKVSRLFKVKMSSVSVWKATHIPAARMMYIEAVFPEVLKPEYSYVNDLGATVTFKQ